MPKKKTSKPKAGTPVTKFNQTNVGAILEECREALAPIAEKYGLVLDRKGRTYHHDALPVMFQMLVKKTDEDGNVITADGKAFIEQAVFYGLKPEDLGQEFTSRGKKFRITGLKPRSRKYPVLAEEVATGKTYKFPAEAVKAGLSRAA